MQDKGNINNAQERSILSILAKITSITDLSTLLKVVTKELPSVVGGIGCFIYLHHKYVPEYSGVLIRNGKELSEDEVAQSLESFIVLAATNLESKVPLIGKAYFGAGEGVTGWVYKYGRPLLIDNLLDDTELKSKSADLFWANEYNDGDELYNLGDRRPLLAVPLILDDEPIGTLKFHARIDKLSFTEVSQEIAIVVSRIISGVLRQTLMVADQSKTISRLIETSNKEAPIDVIADITRSMKAMLNCSRSEFFLRSRNGENIRLIVRDGEYIPRETQISFKRGQSLLGWVFKTGLPLIIPNIREFVLGVKLSDELLEMYSVNEEINEDDKIIRYEENVKYITETSRLQMIAFLATPVKSQDKEILGVLCAYRRIPIKSSYPFDRSQLILAESFANTIALVLENARQKRLSNLLTELGNLTQSEKLLELVTKEVPVLVASSGCSIFVTATHRGVQQLKLTNTSRKSILGETNQIPNIRYELGESKTGMCGLYQRTLIVNHYGKGKSSVKKLDMEKERVEADHSFDVVTDLYDNFGNKVGLFQMRSDIKLHLKDRATIRGFAKEIIFQESGITSSKLNIPSAKEHTETWSYIAVPITSDGKLLGVITLARSTPETPFVWGDITLLQSIAGRLASVLMNLRFLADRESLVMSLAHEITTPLTGILADSENLYQETAENTDIRKIAQHNLLQVLRLQMQASAIISILSDQKTARHFSTHSIYRPLKEACELFESEAAIKGCDIIDPKARNGSFPAIEMSLDDLTIAFKNIIHNAVKYSFKPPINLDAQRTIKIWGEWNNDQKNYYKISIQNYGVGILPNEIERRLIFEPYYRGEKASDRRRTGSGFGLTHARLVIEDMHKGEIRVTSINVGGDAYLTTFEVILPVKQKSK